MVIASYSGTKTTYDLLEKPIASSRREAIVYVEFSTWVVAYSVNGKYGVHEEFIEQAKAIQAAKDFV